MSIEAPAVDLAEFWRERRLAWELYHLGLGSIPQRLPGIDYEADSVITHPAASAAPDTYAPTAHSDVPAGGQTPNTRASMAARSIRQTSRWLSEHGRPNAEVLQRE